MQTRCKRLAHDEGREVVGRAGDERDAGRRRSDGQGRIRAALATDQPQEGRSTTDGPDLGRSSKAAFAIVTSVYLPRKEISPGTFTILRRSRPEPDFYHFTPI